MKEIIVIGSGLAGSVLCRELSKSANVTLLEKGEKDLISYPNLLFKEKKLAPFNTFCFSGGGGSNLWHNGLIPIGIDDVISKPFAELLKKAEPYTNKAAEMLNFDGDYSADYADIVSEMNELAASIGFFEDGVDCLIYPKKYSKLTVPNKVKAYYSVRNIAFTSIEDETKRVTFTQDDRTHSIDADFIILAAGTFSTPELVKRILQTNNLNNEELGRGLIDHPAGFVGKVKFTKDIAKKINKFSSYHKDNYESCTGIRIKSDCQKYTCFAFLRPAFTMSNHLSIYQYKSLLGGSSGIERIKNALSLKLFHPDILVEVISHVLGVSIPSNTFNVLVYFQQHQGDNEVDYKEGSHVIKWDVKNKELEVYNALLEKLDQKLNSFAIETNMQKPINNDWLRSGAHHSGTISLDEKKIGCINENLKLNGSSNVYVCDGSVIQEHSYANTGLTIGKLALRLSEHINQLNVKS
ncbi:MAG: hypothetical protein ACJAS9_002875 [Polaribacter sp.]|jgi:hypothetical protein